jgi:hypothetical protein
MVHNRRERGKESDVANRNRWQRHRDAKRETKAPAAQVSFKCSPEDGQFITQIAARAVRMATKLGVTYDLRSWSMDVTAVHCNAVPLDLPKLLQAGEFDFAHDLLGIRRHLDRETGQLRECFLPRCALPMCEHCKTNQAQCPIHGELATHGGA